MKGNLKLLVVEDTKAAGSSHTRTALGLIKGIYETATGGEVTLTWDFTTRELAIPFISNVPSFGWCTDIYGRLKTEYGDKHDFYIFVVHKDHWPVSYGGIHNGIFQLPDRTPVSFVFSRLWESSYGMRITIEEEMAHSFNDWGGYRPPRPDLTKLFPISSAFAYDETIVHGWRWNYSEIYSKLKEYLIAWFPWSGESQEENESMIVDQVKLTQIFNELLLRDPDAGAVGYIGKEESFVRREVGASQERARIVALVGAARKVQD